jgi:DNA-binding XRE family transcriptional regulator
MRRKHPGSNFEDFLAEEGILEECRASALREVRRRARQSKTSDEISPPALPKKLPNGNYPVEAMRLGLARRLIRDRRAVGLTQIELARRAGIAAESLNRIEKGKLTPTMATMHKIDRALEAAEKAQSKLDAKSN